MQPANSPDSCIWGVPESVYRAPPQDVGELRKRYMLHSHRFSLCRPVNLTIRILSASPKPGSNPPPHRQNSFNAPLMATPSSASPEHPKARTWLSNSWTVHTATGFSPSVFFLLNHLQSLSTYLTPSSLSSIFIALPHPPRSLNLSLPFWMNSLLFLSTAATTPHEFLITGDFNIHVDNPTDQLTSQFLTVLSSFNLTQQVDFPIHNKNHILWPCNNLLWFFPSTFPLYILVLSIWSLPHLHKTLCSQYTTFSSNLSLVQPSSIHRHQLIHFWSSIASTNHQSSYISRLSTHLLQHYSLLSTRQACSSHHEILQTQN